MNWKIILTTGLIFFSCSIFAQTSDRKTNINQVLNRPPGDIESQWATKYRYQPAFKAEDLFRVRKAAEGGDASAQFLLALRYDVGQGVPEDPAEAVRWLRKAAEQGFVKAQFNLADMYYSGHGVTQDHTEAANWYRKAAERGFASAQKNLGALYGMGQGVPQNDSEAFVWSSIAANSGDSGAAKNRDIAASKLSTEEYDLAQIRMSELRKEIQQRKVREEHLASN